MFFASCLILALHNHKVFLDKDYIAHSFSFLRSKLNNSPLLLNSSIQSVENINFLLNNLRLNLTLSREACVKVFNYFEKCQNRSSGSNPLINLAFHVYLYQTHKKNINKTSVLCIISESFNISKKSIVRLFQKYNYCCFDKIKS